MPKKLSRRRFLHSGLVLGAGFGIQNLPGLQTQGASMPLELTGTLAHVHDPVIIRADDAYYVFCTGDGIPIRKSVDLTTWQLNSPARVFRRLPEWAQEMVPGATNIWAPDISYFNDKYHLYYSVSTFGSNRSLIGLITNRSLDSDSENYEWVDEGLVLESVRANNHNAIDPNLIIDADGVPWLAFGSHWSGIKMRRLDYQTGKPSAEDPKLYDLAQRAVHPRAIEAPFIIRKSDYYYLFVSFDSCCRGIESTYRVMVGRSENITGPYIDRDGVSMMRDGGTQVTFPTERWIGPGHNAILQENGVEYIVYHAYDADNAGVPTLRIDPLEWDAEGWPFILV